MGAEKLPLVDLKGAMPLPALDTESAIRTGVVLGAAGGVERILEGLRPTPTCPVFLTGADAALLSPHLRVPHRVHGGLGLLGVALALRRSPPPPRSGVSGPWRARCASSGGGRCFDPGAGLDRVADVLIRDGESWPRWARSRRRVPGP